MRPLNVEFRLNGHLLPTSSIALNEWQNVELDVSKLVELKGNDFGEYELEIRADRTWQPRPFGSQRDDREISIAVANIQLSD